MVKRPCVTYHGDMTTIWSPLPEHDATGGRVTVTSPYRGPGRPDHYGLDLGTTDGIELGTPLYAVEDSEIVFQQPASAGAGAGHYTHLLGASGFGWRYLHQLETLILPVGTKVKAGQQIGHVGNTGGVAAHLHLEKLANVGKSTAGWFVPANTRDPEPDVRAAWNAGRWPGSTPTPPSEEDDVTPQDIEDITKRLLERLADENDQLANQAREEIAYSSWFAIGGQGKAQAKPGERLAQPWATVGEVQAAVGAGEVGDVNVFTATCELIAQAAGKPLVWNEGKPSLGA